MKKIISFLILICCFTTCDKNENDVLTEVDEVASDDIVLPDDLFTSDYNILFIGNSLTYTNGLPQLVKEEAAERDINLGVISIAKSNYAIVDHWANGNVQDYIKTKAFDYVVIQQGPSSQQDGRDMLMFDGKKYKDLCNENEAELCFFMVWPAKFNYSTFDNVIRNYTDAATFNDAILCPVGQVWKNHFYETNNFDYYGADGFHPSLLGSQVAAEVIVDSIFF